MRNRKEPNLVLQFVIMIATTLSALLMLSVGQTAPQPLPLLRDLPLVGVNQPADGLMRRGTLGIGFQPLSPAQRTELKLTGGEGILALKPLPGLTADKAGIKEGDVVTKINDKLILPGMLGPYVRELKNGSTVTFTVLRGGKELTLSAQLSEKPRDPGGPNYTVTYSHIVDKGNKMRTIITTPKKPGKHPGFMFIQGFSPVSYDFTLEGSTGDVTSLDGPLLYEFANSNFVTIRVEKPGVGDSEGGPFAPMDYHSEIGIYKETLKQLKGLPGVDTDNVFIFGHSMGGAFGPMIAAENPVKGIAVYGTAARTWFEYLLDTIRYQGLVGGDTFENTDEIARQGARLMALVFLENKSPEEVKKSHPQLTSLVDSFFPGGLFNAKNLDFWRQLAQINFPAYWAKTKAHVLAVRGASDFVTYDADHKLIADVMNKVSPGLGTFKIAPNSDHLFHAFATEQESMQNWQRGKFSPVFTKMMMDWIRDVMKKTEKK